jgi:hypothetical protein
MSFVQYEIWGSIDGHEELIECVPTLKEAEEILENEREFHDEVWIIKDEDGFDPKEVSRVKGL